LDVGCGSGEFGARLKADHPGREVFGIERSRGPALEAAKRLDRVFTADAEDGELALDPESIDCLIYRDVLGQFTDPESVLRKHRRFLRAGGLVLCSIVNAQHHSLLSALCTGDVQYAESGILDDARLRFYSRSTLIKLLLDAGFSPELMETVSRPCPPEFWDAVHPLVSYCRLDPKLARRHFDAYEYVFRATPLDEGQRGGRLAHEMDHRVEPPLTFVACVSDEAVLRANLLASPCLRGGTPHEIRLVRNSPTAADGLNDGLASARHDWVICVHQDVYLPAGWPTRFWQQLGRAQQMHGVVGVAGVFGARGAGDESRLIGHVVHQERPLRAGKLPAAVDTLDELLLALPRQVGLRFEPAVGWHFYGSDLCLQARRSRLAVVALDAPCSHNTRNNWYPPGFSESGAAFARKWADALPLATPCILVDADGSLRLPPNA
jgi:SAM-dependent methyltransferase